MKFIGSAREEEETAAATKHGLLNLSIILKNVLSRGEERKNNT